MKFPWSTSIVDVLKNESKLGEKLDHIAKALTNHKEDISKVVEELGPALTHKDVDIRLKGTKFLSDLLRSLPSDLLDETQLKFITDFYCDRMKDHHSIAPQVVTGLVSIVKMKHLPRSSPVEILRAMFANIPCQSQVRGDRANILTIISYLSDNFEPEFKAMGADFLYGVIQAVEGERDPRNLVFLFEFMPRFLNTYPLFHFTEDMFEVFSCYFPVDFHPAPNDPEAITRDVLADKLAKCLCAANGFSKFCVELALEKLEGDLKQAKIDSLNLLTKAAEKFDNDSLMEQYQDIWEALKKEFLQESPHIEVRNAALMVIKAFIERFHQEQHDLESILNRIFTSTIGILLARDSKFHRQALEITLTCAEAADTSCTYVTNKVFPVFLTELTSQEITEFEKIDVLEDFKRLVQLVKKNNLLSSYTNDTCTLNIQKEIMKILMSKSSDDLMKVTWQIISVMAGIVTTDNRSIILKRLSAEIKTSTPEQDDCLLSFAKQFPQDVYKIALEPYVNQKYDEADDAKNVFQTFSFLVDVPELQNEVVDVLCLNVFNNPSRPVKLVVLEIFQDILKTHDTDEIARFLQNEWKIVVKLMDLIKNENIEEGQEVMYQSTLLMHLVVQKLPQDVQMELVDKYLPLMDLSNSIPDLYVTSGILGFLDPAVPVDGHFEKLVTNLVQMSLNSTDERARKIANHLLCSLFNRAPVNDKHKKILKKIYDMLKGEVKNHKHQAVEILGWLSKGLLARGHPDAAEILETLSELLDHPKLRYAATLAFEIISVECPQLHLPLLKHLFKQKIFVLSMKFLESKIEKFSEHHLTAMAHILQITPFQVLKLNTEKVGPILFKCIKSSDDPGNVKQVLLCNKILKQFISHKSQYIVDHLQHLVNDFLKLTVFKSSLEVRKTACESLEMLTVYPLFTLVPYKNDVIHGLEPALDDHKRIVRSAAVAARLAWYNLGEEK